MWIELSRRKKKNLQVLETSLSCFGPFGVWGVTPANDTKIQNIIGKDVEPHSCWYCTKSISFHWFINFGFWPFLVELIFECRFETFNIFCPLFFPRHFKHEIKNQTRQLNPNFNCLSHSKPPKFFIRLLHNPTNLILSLLSLSLSFIYNQCNHHHRSPHKPQPLQATSHNTTKIRSTTISRPKLDQTHSLKKKKKKTQSGVVRLTSSTLGVVGFSFDQPP